jgi:hypothetical protein
MRSLRLMSPWLIEIRATERNRINKQMEHTRTHGELISEITAPEADVQSCYDALQKTLNVVHSSQPCTVKIGRYADGIHFIVQHKGNRQSFGR